MKVREIMTADVETAAPDDSIQTAAQMMDDLNVGVLPVCDGSKLVGMVTDRDITVRATSIGQDPARCTVSQVMSVDVQFCSEDDALDEVRERMAAMQARRLPVLDADRRLVGIVSLGDIAADGDSKKATGRTLSQISQPAQPDR